MRNDDKIKKYYKEILPDELNQIINDDFQELKEKIEDNKKAIDNSFLEIETINPNFVFNISI